MQADKTHPIKRSQKKHTRMKRTKNATLKNAPGKNPLARTSCV